MASRTVLQLLTAAAEELGAIASGETLSTGEQASGLDRYNRMVDASSADRAQIFCERRDLLTLTISKQTYTIGKDPAGSLTADLDVTRPTKIVRSNLLLTSAVRRPVKVLTLREWAAIRYQAVSGPPLGVYPDKAFVTGFETLYFDRIPDKAYQWEMYSWQQNGQAASVSAAIDYPPSYADYWLYSMAIRLGPMFGRPISPDLRESFRAAREIVLALNCVSPELNPDPATLADGGGLYNWMSGEME